MLKVLPHGFKVTIFALLFTLLVGCGTPEPINESPRLSFIAAQTGFQNEQITIPFSITDESPNNLSFTAASSDQTIIKDSSIQVTGSGSERQLVITPEEGTGTTVITLTVTNNKGLSDDQIFVLNIEEATDNDPPMMSPIDDQTGEPQRVITLPFMVLDEDVNSLA